MDESSPEPNLAGLSAPPRHPKKYTYEIHPAQEIKRGCWMAFGMSLFFGVIVPVVWLVIVVTGLATLFSLG